MISTISATFCFTDCYNTKGCFLKPYGCVPYVNCTYAFSYQSDGEWAYLELLGKTNSERNNFVAAAFSRDQQMGDDSVVECSSFNNGPLLGRASYNQGKTNIRLNLQENHSNNFIRTLAIDYVNGMLYCHIARRIQAPTGVNPVQVFPLNNQYHILMSASTTTSDANGNGVLQVHNLNHNSPMFPMVSLTAIHVEQYRVPPGSIMPTSTNGPQFDAESQQNQGYPGQLPQPNYQNPSNQQPQTPVIAPFVGQVSGGPVTPPVQQYPYQPNPSNQRPNFGQSSATPFPFQGSTPGYLPQQQQSQSTQLLFTQTTPIQQQNQPQFGGPSSPQPLFGQGQQTFQPPPTTVMPPYAFDQNGQYPQGYPTSNVNQNQNTGITSPTSYQGEPQTVYGPGNLPPNQSGNNGQFPPQQTTPMSVPPSQGSSPPLVVSTTPFPTQRPSSVGTTVPPPSQPQDNYPQGQTGMPQQQPQGQQQPFQPGPQQQMNQPQQQNQGQGGFNNNQQTQQQQNQQPFQQGPQQQMNQPQQPQQQQNQGQGGFNNQQLQQQQNQQQQLQNGNTGQFGAGGPLRDEYTNQGIIPGSDNPIEPQLLKVHAILMTLSWMIFVSTAILFARFYRGFWPNTTLCGLFLWFHFHRTMNLIAIGAMIAGFVCIFVARDWHWRGPSPYKTREENNAWPSVHAMVGLLACLVAWAQPLNAVFRCHPKALLRPLYNIIHAFFGYGAFVMGATALMIACTHFDFMFTNKSAAFGLCIAFICTTGAVFIVLEIMSIFHWFKNRHSTGDIEVIQPDGRTHVTLSEQTKKINICRSLIFFFYIIAAGGCAIAISILIGIKSNDEIRQTEAQFLSRNNING